MIRYRLQCNKAHEFEAWFPSSAGFEKQAKNGLVSCPQCGSPKVTKTLMAPSVVTSERKTDARKRRRQQQPVDAPTAAGPAPAPPATAATQFMLNDQQREMMRQLKAMRDKVLAEAEYVGPRFAEEARKIHHDEQPARGIYGEASPAEVKELAEDGIAVFPVPVLPEDQN